MALNMTSPALKGGENKQLNYTLKGEEGKIEGSIVDNDQFDSIS